VDTTSYLYPWSNLFDLYAYPTGKQVLRTVPTHHHHHHHHRRRRYILLFFYHITVWCVLKGLNVNERVANKRICSSSITIGAQAHPNDTFSTSNGLAWDWTRVTAVITWRLTIWATVRPKIKSTPSVIAAATPSASRVCRHPPQVSLSIGPATHTLIVRRSAQN